MNQVEQLQGTMVLLLRRIERLEKLHEAGQAKSADASEALALVRELELDGDTLVNVLRFDGRKRVARELRLKGWGHERIARCLNCSEKSVRRWCPDKSGQEQQG